MVSSFLNSIGEVVKLSAIFLSLVCVATFSGEGFASCRDCEKGTTALEGRLRIKFHESACSECEVSDDFAPPERALTRIIRQQVQGANECTDPFTIFPWSSLVPLRGAVLAARGIEETCQHLTRAMACRRGLKRVSFHQLDFLELHLIDIVSHRLIKKDLLLRTRSRYNECRKAIP